MLFSKNVIASANIIYNQWYSQTGKSKTPEQSLKIRRAIVRDWSEEHPFRSIQ